MANKAEGYPQDVDETFCYNASRQKFYGRLNG